MSAIVNICTDSRQNDNASVKISSGHNNGMMTGNANEVSVAEEVLDGEGVGDGGDWSSEKV